LLYINGRIQQAAYWFDYLKKTYTNAFILRQANISLKDFVLGTVAEDDNETDENRVMGNLEGMYVTEFQCLIQDNMEEAQNYDQLARDVWNHFHEKIGALSAVRLGLKPPPEIKQRVLDNLLDPNSGMMNPYYQNVLRTKLGLKNPGTNEPPPVAAPSGPTAPP